ncbi:MAG: DUF2079 domain-containing protein [Acidimicrobiales bacterium]
MSELSFQRRFRRQLVRLQARLEAGTGDRWIPPVVALLLSAVLTSLSVARVRGVDAGIDLAGYAQALWLLGEGKLPQASLFGDGVHLLGVHWSFVVYPLALPAKLASTATVLVVAQSIALGLGVIPLWRLPAPGGQLACRCLGRAGRGVCVLPRSPRAGARRLPSRGLRRAGSHRHGLPGSE